MGRPSRRPPQPTPGGRAACRRRPGRRTAGSTHTATLTAIVGPPCRGHAAGRPSRRAERTIGGKSDPAVGALSAPLADCGPGFMRHVPDLGIEEPAPGDLQRQAAGPTTVAGLRAASARDDHTWPRRSSSRHDAVERGGHGEAVQGDQGGGDAVLAGAVRHGQVRHPRPGQRPPQGWGEDRGP